MVFLSRDNAGFAGMLMQELRVLYSRVGSTSLIAVS